MSRSAAALDHKAAVTRIADDAVRGALRYWGRLDPADLRGSWAEVLPHLLILVTGAQRSAAGMADPYLTRMLGDEDAPTVDTSALSGIASDGRPLPSLLTQPLYTVLSHLKNGRTVDEALSLGLVHLTLIVRTQVHDAARVADLVGITARPGAAYTRVVALPACARCIALAGREYSYAEGFERHPNCDCAIMPIRAGDAIPLTPAELVEQMTPDERVRRFGAAGAAAIRDGADVAEIVQNGRGMSTASRPSGSAGDTTRHPPFEYRSGAAFRLMPEQIIAEAADRAAAIEELVRNGFLSRPDPGPYRLGDNIDIADPGAPHARELLAAIEIIADLHSVDRALPEIPLVEETESNYKGRYIHTSDGKPTQFRLAGNGPTPRLTAVHELGHVLDHLLLGSDRRELASETENDTGPGGILAEWWSTVKATDYYKMLDELLKYARETGQTPYIGWVKSPDGTLKFYAADLKGLEYLHSPSELFARSYAQWVALRSADDTLIEQLEYLQDLPHVPDGEGNQGYVHLPEHWEDDDFEPLEEIFDRLFDRLGLLEYPP